MTYDDEYVRAISLLQSGLSQDKAAIQLGVSRSKVQRYSWVWRMPYVVENHLRTKGDISDDNLLALEKARAAGEFPAAWKRFRETGDARTFPPPSAARMRDVLNTTTDPVVRRTLEWVLGERNEI